MPKKKKKIFFQIKELKKYITVVLSGEGADEIFGGYGRIFRSPYDLERIQNIDNLDYTKEEKEDFGFNEEIEEKSEQSFNFDEDKEIKKLIILSLSSGLRSSECFNLKKEDFLKIKDNYFVSVKKSKTKSGIRQVPISDFFTFFIDDLLKNKKNEEYIFFNDEQKENRNDNLQKKVMRQIRKYIKDKNKVFHSLRKNYTQLLYKNDTDELYIKLFLGHSYKDNLSFNTYNLSKVDNKLKIQTINNVDFSEIFENINFYDKEREEKRLNDEKLKQHTKYELSL